MKNKLFFLLLILCISTPTFSAATKPTEKKPDLVVSKVTVVPPSAKNKKVTVTYIIKNQGTAASKASKAGITPLTGGKKIQQTTAPLGPGSSVTATCYLDVSKNGNYAVTVSADYINSNVELNEANNENSLRFSVGRIF